MSIIQGNVIDGGASGYTIANSLRFDGSNDYLSRTPVSAGNREKWVIRACTKLSKQTTDLHLWGVDTANLDYLMFNRATNSQLEIQIGGTTRLRTDSATGMLFRDPTAWYDIIVSYDSANATAALRLRVFINGVEITTGWGVDNRAGIAATQAKMNTTVAHNYGRRPDGTGNYYDGHIAIPQIVDGNCINSGDLAITDFGEFNADGVWIPHHYTGAPGTNGMLLDFADGTSTTTLGYDAAGSNDWTLNGMTRAAGVSECWMTDTPTNNFCTISSIDYNATYLTLSEANLRQTYAGVAAAAAARCTQAIPTTGKWYWEIYINATGGGAGERIRVGICKDEAISGNTIDNSATHYMQMSNGQKRTGTTDSTYGAAFSATQIMQVLYDADAGSIYFGQNNSFANGSGSFNQTWSGAVAAFTGLSGTYFPAQITYGGADISINFGQRAFTYTPPSGFQALCTANLPAVTITNPRKHFDVVTRTGTGASYTKTGLLFQPDWWWNKRRDGLGWHVLVDAVRGATKALWSNSTEAETAYSSFFSSFNSDGYSLPANTGADPIYTNVSGQTYVDWLWKANGAGVWNFDGSLTRTATMTIDSPCVVTITSHGFSNGQAVQFTTSGALPTGVTASTTYYARSTGTNTFTLHPTEADAVANTNAINTSGSQSGTHTCENASKVSANTTAGFSIVTYTGTGANATVGHGLGVAPKMVIVKNRDWASGDWGVYHKNLTSAAYFLLLNSTAAQASSATVWNSTDPTSTVFSVGTSNATNLSATKHVAYCFAEVPGFSKFGSYTGNGSTDGPFVFCGFRPRWVLIKMSSASGFSWFIYDTARSDYNVSDDVLRTNLPDAEVTASWANVDVLANGFKLRSADNAINGAYTYIFAAFAENPFGGSNVSPAPAR